MVEEWLIECTYCGEPRPESEKKEASPPSPDEIEEPLDSPPAEMYTALRTIAATLKVLATLAATFGLFFAIYAASEFDIGFLGVVGALFGSALVCLSLYGLAELIALLIAIEGHGRKLVEIAESDPRGNSG
jgi:uncharacterized membrane protein